MSFIITEKHKAKDVRFCFCEFFLLDPMLLYYIINRVELVICKYVVKYEVVQNVLT